MKDFLGWLLIVLLMVAATLVAVSLPVAWSDTPETVEDDSRHVFPGGTRTGPALAADLANDTGAPAGATIWCSDCSAEPGCPAGGTGATAASDGMGGWNCNGGPGAGLSCPGLCGCDLCGIASTCAYPTMCPAIGLCPTTGSHWQEEGAVTDFFQDVNVTGAGASITTDYDHGRMNLSIPGRQKECTRLRPLQAFDRTIVLTVGGQGSGTRVLAVGCFCFGACTTVLPTFTFPTSSGGPISLSGTLTCQSLTTDMVWVNTDPADSDRELPEGRAMYAAVTNGTSLVNDDEIRLCLMTEPR